MVEEDGIGVERRNTVNNVFTGYDTPRQAYFDTCCLLLIMITPWDASEP